VLAAAVALAAALSVAPARAAVAAPVTVEQLARASEAVVRGRVASVTARWVGKRIYSFVELEVAETWRGSAPARLTVLTPGGVVGKLGQRTDGAAVFASGEEVVAFLGRAEGGHHGVTGLAQGKFAVHAGSARPDLSHTRFVAATVPEGERRAEEMPVDELRRRVRAAR
jgi:hypothetical protein